MRHTIENDQFKVSVKETGAELCSMISKRSGKEYIWQADPDVWGAHAPNLFPVIGSLKEDGFLYHGKEYKCPKHGFVRKNENVALIDKTPDSLTFGLMFSKESLEIYPFKFEFLIKFRLEGNKLCIEHKITNHGDREMLFSLGGHPGFTCPLNDDEKYDDYYLEFEKPETAPTWRVLKNGLIAKETLPFFENSSVINLHPHIFDDDALVFKNLNSSRVSLKSKKSKQVLSVDFDDFPNLGIWAKPEADYVCIEPWIGIADSVDSDRNFETKEGLHRLSPVSSFVASYSITIEE
jgi:galactose mutarotase-like enzyme